MTFDSKPRQSGSHEKPLPSQTPRLSTSAAIRQRRLRERKRQGVIFIDLEVGPSAVNCLVRSSCLHPEIRNERVELQPCRQSMQSCGLIISSGEWPNAAGSSGQGNQRKDRL